MKKSKYCEVIQSERKVIKYPRQLGITQEYYRSTPEVDILEKIIEKKYCKVIDFGYFFMLLYSTNWRFFYDD